ncbi:glycosyltransferase family 4 protein [Bdellovibrio bacteriovorus]|uniref:Glycosyltransferase n=2 Tax=Bdellovibrio bacteriovorus TaxID=959 RepID=A0A1Z3NBD5_BDEBC|nr:glycosyltransferase family 4 protein [Bdellovibrio bacteriovorus]AHZ86780.1 glycosyltransferase [Bdellovibrio bacteriovorus]ASD64757.1 glycosyltransferase [Bdellovibrio bacteriovorus]BEV67220.1 D-inositol-3-phosphate glycosyltransferase [Bdellovibrio bacteriovorus]CAE78671.1 putative glycosyltransferase [Bdellovibrio bacteriovorus HD100]
MAKKSRLPETLNICLTSQRFPILSRATDHGFLWPIARGLAREGHKVTVLAASSALKKPEVTRDGVKVFYLHEGAKNLSHLNFQMAVRQKFAQLHKEDPFHIVHSIDKSGYRIATRKDDFKVAVAYDVEATQMSQLFAILAMKQDTLGSMLTTAVATAYKFLTTYYGGDRQLLSTADGIFVTNPQQRIILERYYLYPDFHTYTVPYGIELGDLTPKEKSLELRKKLGIPENAHVAVSITDMTDVQEVIPLLRAFEKVAIKKPGSYLLLVGNGPKFKDIEFQVLNLALGNRVILTGAIPAGELEDYIVLGDAFVNMGSRTTGFEPSTLEAMAQKKVVLGSEVSPIANIIEDGRDGFLLRPADVDSMSNLLVEIFSGTMPADEIGDRARQKVVDLFDTAKMVQSVLDAYRKILLNTGLYKKH